MDTKMIRGWQYSQLRRMLGIVENIFAGFEADEATTLRDGGDGWTAAEVAGHLRDFEALFHERAVLTVQHGNPPLPFPDPAQLAAERDYNSQPLAESIAAWKANREAHLAFLEGLEDAAFLRMAQHPKRGPLTLLDQLALTTWHDILHTEQVQKILAQRG